jgi:hypothetical protein
MLNLSLSGSAASGKNEATADNRKLLAKFAEVETGKRCGRQKLAKAIAL